jgi:hypothetical protein
MAMHQISFDRHARGHDLTGEPAPITLTPSARTESHEERTDARPSQNAGRMRQQVDRKPQTRSFRP